MDREIAESTLATCSKIGSELNKITELTIKMDDEATARAIRRSLASIMAIVYEDMMLDIIRTYPDLDPDKEFLK